MRFSDGPRESIGHLPQQAVDLARFREGSVNLDELHFVLTVKSQDQSERRRRMVENLNRGVVARVSNRPVAQGFVGIGRLRRGRLEIERQLPLEEPRHVVEDHNGHILITTATAVLRLSRSLDVLETFSDPLFSFLHTIELSPDGERLLVCSTGYDCVIELERSTGARLGLWNAWTHGFNPDLDGNWLTLDPAQHEKWLAEGKRSKIIDPSTYGAYGVSQSQRSAHPNFARYDEGGSVLVNIAFSGELYRMTFRNSDLECVLRRTPMAHSLYRLANGWGLAETTVGQWTLLDREFREVGSIVSRSLGHKHPEAGAAEWLQHVFFPRANVAVFLDANRGIFAADLENETLEFFVTPPELCFQDAIIQTNDRGAPS